MNELIFSLTFIPVLLLNFLLSLSPFVKMLSKKRVGIILCANVAISACAWGAYYYAAVSGIVTFAIIKHIFLLSSLLAAIVNILHAPRHYREWIFSAALVTLFHYLISAIAAFIVYRTAGWGNMQAYTYMGQLSCLLILLFYLPMRHMVIKTIRPFLSYEAKNYWRTIYLIPVTMLFACYCTLPGNAHMETVGQVFSRLYMVAAALLICSSISADYATLQEKQATEAQLQQQKLYYSSMTADLEYARRQRHDMKHHLSTIAHYIETENLDGLRKYCGELEKKDEMHHLLPYSGNSAADGVLYHYIQCCKQQKIRFSFQGVLHTGNIADTDLCVLLGNALDNALAGCQTAPGDRFLCVAAQSEEHLLSILVQNSFDGTVRLSQTGALMSRKRHDRVGVGIQSMRTVCEHYGGTLEQSWTDDTFTLCILLPMDPPNT